MLLFINIINLFENLNLDFMSDITYKFNEQNQMFMNNYSNVSFKELK